MAQAELSMNWLRRARRLNPHYHKTLQWTVPAGWPSDVGSADFALRVAAMQREHGSLTADGILGPKTLAAMTGATWAPPAGNHLIVAGRRVPVPFPVVTWQQPDGLSFYGRAGWNRRRDPNGRDVDMFVLHWDGCTSAHQCFHVLLERGLSVHCMLDGDGTVYQALDLATARAWHAGRVNERSVGVEIQNPVKLNRNRWQSPPRPVVMEKHVHRGGTWEHLDFYEIQKERVVQLAQAVCEHVGGVPQRLPMGADGAVTRTLASPDFRGVCGHYHVSQRKPDPGLSLWPGLMRAFYPNQSHGEQETDRNHV